MHYLTTKDGKEMPISKMTDTHLLNTIKMLDRYYKGGIVVCGGHYYEEGDGDFYDNMYQRERQKWAIMIIGF